jgi:hypothetical protein
MSLVREQLHLVAARRRCVDQDSLQDRRGDSLTSISRGDDDRFHEHGRSAVVRDVWHHERGGSTDEYIPDLRHIDHEVARGHHVSPRLCLPLGYRDRDTAAGFVFGVDLENSLKVVVERIRTEKADAAVIESACSRKARRPEAGASRSARATNTGIDRPVHPPQDRPVSRPELER